VARRPTRATRGILTRALGLALGVALGGGAALATVLPLEGRAATVRATFAPWPSAQALHWPSAVSAAVYVPSVALARQSDEVVRPVASLTKMMTVYVALGRRPLTSASGPCLRVSEADVADYLARRALDQSVAAVAAGEVLCERDLVAGLLIASANNYADLLARLVADRPEAFVAQMNATARTLGLFHTHYVEPSGFDPGSVSTALEQARLASRLMAIPLARELVAQPTVTLPVAGTLATFTPDLGVEGVVGVKSGRTDQAGGCVALAAPAGPSAGLAYAVVLGARGGDLLAPAGLDALTLLRQVRHEVVSRTLVPGARLAALAWGGRAVGLGVASPRTLTGLAGSARLRVEVNVTRAVRRGERVGWLIARGARPRRVALVAQRSLTPPSIWDRLR
jgi:D-alanyl-D-alanine carboxypeptidase (penicillin-binding protein 5/6)